MAESSRISSAGTALVILYLGTVTLMTARPWRFFQHTAPWGSMRASRKSSFTRAASTRSPAPTSPMASRTPSRARARPSNWSVTTERIRAD